MDPQIFKGAILNAAIQGKLVPQDPDDEPASVLIEKINVEKQRLVKEGKIKKNKNESRIYRKDGKWFELVGKNQTEIELNLDIPDTWTFARLSSIAIKINDGTHNSPKLSNDGKYRYVSAKNIKNGNIIFPTNEFVSDEDHKQIYSRCSPEYGDVLLTKDGTVGEVCINRMQEEFSLLSSVSLIKIPHDHFCNEYLEIALNSPYLQHQMNDNQSGTALRRIILEKINSLIIPIPPLAEQKCICQFVKQLFEISSTHQALIEKSQSYFDIIKKYSLNLAIQGKLTKQKESDGTAVELIEKINAEKQRLIKEGKIKKTKNESMIYRKDGKWFESIGNKENEIEVPFEIPDSWVWCRGNNCFNPQETANPTDNNFRYIDIDSIDNKAHKISKIKILNRSDAPSRAKRKTKPGDVVFSTVRPYLENIAQIPSDLEGAIASTGFFVCSPRSFVDPDYLYFMMCSPFVINGINRFMKGDNSPSVNNEVLYDFLYPIPTLSEQKRIASKVSNIYSIIISSSL